NDFHREGRPDRVNLFSTSLDRTGGLRQIQAIHPREDDSALPSLKNTTVHRRQFLRQDGIESTPAARSGQNRVRPRPSATGPVLPTGGLSRTRSCAPVQKAGCSGDPACCQSPFAAQSPLVADFP